MDGAGLFWTRGSLGAAIRSVGAGAGALVSVHVSMSRLGYVVGGAETVVDALLDAVGPEGTVVMQTHTSENSDPASWRNPPAPESWWEAIREHTPAFRADRTPGRKMSAVSEHFRTSPGVVRSEHPSDSCAALGPLAEAITCAHPLTPAMGAGSPLARMVDHDVQVLLLGVDHGNNTLLHYAEHLAEWPGKREGRFGSAMLVEGRREWVWRQDLVHDDRDFVEVGEAFAATGGERLALPLRCCSGRALVAFASQWFSARRRGPGWS
jgi:aminoglycoside 3-N-acetyltransferase